MKAAFTQCTIFVISGWRQDNGLDFSCCDIVQSSDNMVKSTVMAGLRLRIGPPPCGTTPPAAWRKLDGDGSWGSWEKSPWQWPGHPGLRETSWAKGWDKRREGP